MSNTIQTTAASISAVQKPASDAPAAGPPAGPEVKAPVVKSHPFTHYLFRGVKALASLRLTVVLFVLSILLVFFGTLAQIDSGIWNVVGTYFRWFWVWIPFQLLVEFGKVFLGFLGFPRELRIPGAFPFPGGLTLGILLLANLLAAHAIRFKLSWKRTGILLIHAGLILMIAGEFFAYFALEGRMTIEEGETANFVIDTRHYELAVTSPDDKEKDRDHVTVVPNSLLRNGKAIHSDELPFDIEVTKWLVNGVLRDPKEGEPNPATKGLGLTSIAVDQGEVSGVDTNQSVEYPACYIQVKKKDGTDLGTYLMSAMLLREQPIRVDGKTYQVALRFRRDYKPYSMELLKFTYGRYPGTNTPKDFSSKIRLRDTETGEDREVLIRMNEPLRHRGETFYQGDWNKETERGTVLQVVRNPGWLLPYFSCAIVSLGMIIHFGLNLTTFLQRRAG